MALISKQEVEEAAFKLVMSTKKHFEELRKRNGLVAEWKAAENSYFNGTDDFYQGVSKVRVPVLHQAVERIVPKIDNVIFPPDGEFFKAKAKDYRDDLSVQDAKVITSLIKQQFSDVGVRSKLIGIDRSLCIYGTVFLTTFWDRKIKERFKRVGGKRTNVYDVVFDNPDFYSPRIWDIYIDPKDEDLEGWLIEEVKVNYTDLWDLRKRKNNTAETGIYDNVAKLKDRSLFKEDNNDKKDSDELTRVGGHEYGPHEHKITVLKAWGDIPKWFITRNDKDREEKTVIKNALIELGVVGEGGEVLRIVDNPFDHQEKPYLRGRYIKIDGRAYGLGVMSVNIPLEAELNTLRNQLMDLRTFILRKKWIVDRSANIDENQLEDINNKVIYTDLLNGIRDIVPADFSPSAGVQEEKIKQDIQDSTGASKLLSGVPSNSSLDRTAIGVTTAVQSGLDRFELVVTQLQEDILKPLVRHFWMLNQQFLPEGRDVALVGEGILRVMPEEIPLEGFDYNFIGIREIGVKDLKVNQLNVLVQNISSLVQFGLDPIPLVIKQMQLMGFSDLVHEIDMRPQSQLEETPEGEVQLLRLGRSVKINLNDDHDSYIVAYTQLLQEPNLPDNVKANTLEALGQRQIAKKIITVGFKSTPGAPEFGGRTNDNTEVK